MKIFQVHPLLKDYSEREDSFNGLLLYCLRICLRHVECTIVYHINFYLAIHPTVVSCLGPRQLTTVCWMMDHGDSKIDLKTNHTYTPQTGKSGYSVRILLVDFRLLYAFPDIILHHKLPWSHFRITKAKWATSMGSLSMSTITTTLGVNMLQIYFAHTIYGIKKWTK